MANYSALDFTECYDRLHPGIPNRGQPNPCVPWPNSFNPYNVTKLQDFGIEMLQEIISNPFFGEDLNLCYDMADILPDTFVRIDDIINSPRLLDLPVLGLHTLAQRTLPSTINSTTNPVDIIDWWWNNVENHTQATTNFLNATADKCTFAVCESIDGIGDKDITGIGMLISTAMLIVLAAIFSIPALFNWTSQAQSTKRSTNKEAPVPSTTGPGVPPSAPTSTSTRTRLRASLLGTLDDLLAAILIFTLSVLVSSLIYRLSSHTIYDIFMAETLSLLSASAMVLVAASYFRHARVRTAALAGFALNATLTVALFACEFAIQHAQDPAAAGKPLEQACLARALGGRTPDLNDLGGKRTYFPVCFALWCVALLASLAQLPVLQSRFGLDRRRGRAARWGGRVVDGMPLLFGGAAVVWLCVLFYNTWKEMVKAYGKAFVNGERDWGFGQFLALATWVPPFLTFGHVLFAGMRATLTSRMPKGWAAAIFEEDAESSQVGKQSDNSAA